MDFRGLCQKFDVDNIRARIADLPSLPARPALPQIKVPKSLPKLKSRKIFRSSREDVSRDSPTKTAQVPPTGLPPPHIATAAFIKHTPTRISTISTLRHQDSDEQQNTYQSADSIDEDYTMPRLYSQPDMMMRAPVSPMRGVGLHADNTVNAHSSNPNVRMSLSEKIQKGYKDFSEFRIKHIFAKKTVVRKDNIQVEQYVQHYERDRLREIVEQEQDDHKIAENYKFRFKLTRQITGHSNSVTPDDSPRFVKATGKLKVRSVSENSGDESGMEATPPHRHTKSGIAATRFANVRNPPRSMSRENSESLDNDDTVAEGPNPEKIPSALWSTKINRSPVEQSPTTNQKQTEGDVRSKIADYKERIRRISMRKATTPEESNSETLGSTEFRRGSVKKQMLLRLKNLGSRDNVLESNNADNAKDDANSPPTKAVEPTRDNIKQKMLNRLKSLGSRDDGLDDTAASTETSREGGMRKQMLNKIKSFSGRDSNIKPSQRMQQSPPGSEEDDNKATNQQHTSGDSSFIKNNFRRIQQSFKKPSPTVSSESEEGSNARHNKSNASKISTKTEQFTSRLRRFRSRDVASIDEPSGNEETTQPTVNESGAGHRSPIRQAMDKIDNWKKSFKKKPTKAETQRHNQVSQSDEETSPVTEKPTVKRKRNDTLMRRLKHIRERKSSNSKDDNDADADADADVEDEDADNTRKIIGSGKSRRKNSTKFEEKFTQARQKVNEKMQNLKFFHKTPTSGGASQQTKNVQNQESDNEEIEDEEINIPPTITRREFHDAYQKYQYEEDEEYDAAMETTPARAEWTTKKPILSESMDTDDAELPRVLLHQENSDEYFESTLIIAVTHPVSRLPSTPESPKITELTPEHHYTSPQAVKPREWISNKEIIAGFRRNTPPGSQKRKSSVDSTALLRSLMRNNSHKSTSNSDSDSWAPANTAAEKSRKDNVIRRASTTGITTKITEQEEPWKIHTPMYSGVARTLYKTKSVDIFELNNKQGGACAAFADFDDELKNAPVLKIAKKVRECASLEKDSSEDTADDDSASRITKISVEGVKRETTSQESYISRSSDFDLDMDNNNKRYANSSESLIARFDENENIYSDDDEDEDDRPPSAAPSPPPKMSPPPPPLPLRQPSIRLSKKVRAQDSPILSGPPLPKNKPPIPQSLVNRPAPKIPARSASMTRTAKPLVKTSSLRLAYSEHVKPADVGKVNKLISRFEQPAQEGERKQRPYVVQRRILPDDSEDYTDSEEDYIPVGNEQLKERYANIKIECGTATPTPTNTSNASTPEATASPQISASNVAILQHNEIHDNQTVAEANIIKPRELIIPKLIKTDEQNNTLPILVVKQKSTTDLTNTIKMEQDNLSYSCPGSEYGSPLEYPSSLCSSLETIPTLERKQQLEQLRLARNRRSMTRDDDNFYSFDSDEEHSYYSISSTGSNRYIVEI